LKSQVRAFENDFEKLRKLDFSDGASVAMAKALVRAAESRW
jgi:post-segregation antitoxin (ccd killing protein)